MKKIPLLIALGLLLQTVSVAQATKDSLVKLMARETCTEISKKDLTGKTMEDLEMELGLAMMPIVMKYQDQIKNFGFDIEDQSSMESMGRDVGLQLAKECPAFLKMFVNNPDALKDAIDSKKGKTETGSTGTVSGTLLKVVPGDITYIQVKDASGKIQKIWWMGYFEGSDKLSAESAKYLNKPVKVSFSEQEVYSATLKDYMKIKVITRFE